MRFNHQKGAALAMGLVLSTVACLLAVAGMSSAAFHERVSSNQKQIQESLMAAEAGLIQTADWFSTDNHYQDPSIGGYWGNVEATKTALNSVDKQISTGTSWELANLSFNGDIATIQVRGRLQNSNVERLISMDFQRNIKPIAAPVAEAAFTCFGPACNARVWGNSRVDGRDYALSGDFNCTGASCDFNLASSPRQDSNGIYFTDTTNSGSITLGSGPTKVYGSPDINQTSSYNGEHGISYWNDYITLMENKIAPSNVVVLSSNTTGSIGTRANPKLVKISGSNVTLTGTTRIAGMIVVEAGSTLNFTGTAHHEGIIIIKPGANLTFSSGTAKSYGGIIQLQGSNMAGYDLNLSGNFNIRYSREALQLMENMGKDGADMALGSIKTWRESFE